MTDHPLFVYPNVIVTPHLGASTAEATDRAGYQAAEQVVAALTGGVVTSAVNVPAVAGEDMEALGPFLGLASSLGRIAVALAEATSVDGLEVEYLGRIAERDTRLLTVQVLKGALSGHTEEQVNDVNAPGLAEERGIDVAETKRLERPGLHRPPARDGGRRRGRAHAGGRHRARPPRPPAPARGVGLTLQRAARGPPGDLPLRRPARHARPRGHGPRRRGREHQLGGGRAPPRRERRGRPRRSCSLPPTPRCRRRWSTRSWPSDGFVAGRTVSL